MISLKKNFIVKLIFLLAGTAIVLFLLFNENGIIKYLKLRREVKKLNEEILNAEEKLRSLDSEIDSLKNSRAKIEKVAREKFDMMNKDERVFKIEEK